MTRAPKTAVEQETPRQQDVPKARVRALADELTRAAPEIARIAGRLETEAARGEMAAFSVGLTEQVDAWRQAPADGRISPHSLRLANFWRIRPAPGNRRGGERGE